MSPSDHATDRVRLRPLEPADAPLLETWLADPEVTEALFVPSSPEADYRAEVAASEADLNLGIVLSDGRLVGVAGLSAVDLEAHSASLAIFLGNKSTWGRGIGREAAALAIDHAFGALGLERLWLCVAPTNARALRLYARLGFSRAAEPAAAAGAPVVMELRRQDWPGPAATE